MTKLRNRWLARLAIVFATVAGPGCGLGPGESSDGEATLTVTRDYGSEPLLEATVSDPPQSQTVIRMLDSEAEITTRYGGGFVQSIEGIAGEIRDGRSLDWFFYMNGIESASGAADVPVRGGDRVWWDYRDWSDALRVPAVVGSWPEPFAQVSAEAERLPVRIECAGERGHCDAVSERLSEEGVDASIERPGSGEEGSVMRLLVGPWEAVRDDPAAAQIADGPASSGVFARFVRSGAGLELAGLDPAGRAVSRLGPGAGLVAAVRRGNDPPTWVVTGTDGEGVEAAMTMLDEDHLAERYAVAVSAGAELALPLAGEAGGE